MVGCLEYTTKIPHNLLSIPVFPEVNNHGSLTMNSQDASQFPLIQIENCSFDYVMTYCVYGYVRDRAYIAIICVSTSFLLCVTLYIYYTIIMLALRIRRKTDALIATLCEPLTCDDVYIPNSIFISCVIFLLCIIELLCCLCRDYVISLAVHMFFDK